MGRGGLEACENPFFCIPMYHVIIFEHDVKLDPPMIDMFIYAKWNAWKWEDRQIGFYFYLKKISS